MTIAVVVVLSVTATLWVAGVALSRTSSSGPVAGSSSFVIDAGSPKYDVTFAETGLPTGLNWTLVLAGTHHIQNTTSVTVPQGNGTYAWSILWVEAPGLGFAGWSPNESAGTVVVAGAAVTIDFTFVPGYNLLITGVGLPVGTSWTVRAYNYVVNGTNNPHAFIVPSGTYNVNVTSPVNGSFSGVRYVAGSTFYHVTVHGNTSLSDTFTTQFFLTTSAGPAAGGSATPASAWFNNQSIVALGETPSPGYAFVGWTGSGAGSYTGSNPTPTITMVGPIGEVAGFAQVSAIYTVTFTESGLPSGTNWSVTFNGTLQFSTTPSLSYTATNGSYAFSVGSVNGFTANVSSGTVTVAGANVTVPTGWSAFTYSVTFTESGLPSATNWSVTLGGSPMSSTGSSIVFSEPNGTYSYTVASVAGYAPSPSSGQVTVNATPVTVSIAWTATAPPTYLVSFTESGLPTGFAWNVTLNGTTKSSATATIAFQEPNGTYPVAFPGIPGYRLSGSSASLTTVTVSGSPVSLGVTWAVATYSVTFTETGLPSGTNWSVTLAGTTAYSTGATLTFAEANGSYAFSVSNLSGYRSSPQSGSIQVSGQAVSTTVAFSKISTSSGSSGLTTLDWAAIAAIIVLAVALILVVVYRRRPPAARPGGTQNQGAT